MTMRASSSAVAMSFLGSDVSSGLMAAGRKVPSGLSPLFSRTLTIKSLTSSLYICR
jgi:hypothetical protein